MYHVMGGGGRGYVMYVPINHDSRRDTWDGKESRT